MSFFIVLVLGALAFGSQVVLSLNFTFELSEVRQCEPVSITFNGSSNSHSIPMRLTLVPFDSIPVFLPIPNTAKSISGVYVTFFPFVAGTNFVASLDDTTGENVARVSNVSQVLPSPTGDSTCLPSTNTSSPIFFVLDPSSFSQCEVFTVEYNRNVTSSAPSVRFYNPNGPSRLLDLVSDNSTVGLASYLLDVDRGTEIVITIDDGQYLESSALITVGGDSSSNDKCLSKKNNPSSEGPSGIPRSVIIGGSVGGGVILLIIICMIIFVLRERQIRREASRFNPALLEKGRVSNSEYPFAPPHADNEDKQERDSLGKGQSPDSGNALVPLFSPKRSKLEDGLADFVKDPPYTAEKFLSPTKLYYPRASMESWAQRTPQDQRSSPSKESLSARNEHQDDRSHISLHSLDIENMLNLATIQSGRSSRQTTESVPTGPSRSADGQSAYDSTHKSRSDSQSLNDANQGKPYIFSVLSLDSVVDPFTDENATQSSPHGALDQSATARLPHDSANPSSSAGRTQLKLN